MARLRGVNDLSEDEKVLIRSMKGVLGARRLGLEVGASERTIRNIWDPNRPTHNNDARDRAAAEKRRLANLCVDNTCLGCGTVFKEGDFAMDDCGRVITPTMCARCLQSERTTL